MAGDCADESYRELAMKKKITASEWNSQMRQQAERLVVQGKMPSLDEVLAAVAEVRKKYQDKILKARHEHERVQ